MTTGRRGDGRIFPRQRSPFLWCAYHLRGVEHRESTGTADPKQAAKFLKRRLMETGADLIGATAFVTPQQERVKVGTLMDALEADLKLRGKLSPQVRSHFKHVRGRFASWRAIELTAEAVDQYVGAQLDAGYKPATVNRHTQLLSQAFGLAIERKHLSTAPLFRHLSEKGNERQGFFADSDFHAVVEKLPAYLQGFAQFGYLVGWRKGEIASLRWEDMDGDTIRLRGVNSKNETPRLVLGGELAEIIERQRADRQVETKSGMLLSAYVFHLNGARVGDFRKAWATACVAAGLGQFVCKRCNLTIATHWCRDCKLESRYTGRTFHDFRRSAGRNMVRAGVPEKVAMAITGHKTRSMFDRYNIVNEEDLRSAMDRTHDYLKKIRQQPGRAAITPIRAAAI